MRGQQLWLCSQDQMGVIFREKQGAVHEGYGSCAVDDIGSAVLTLLLLGCSTVGLEEEQLFTQEFLTARFLHLLCGPYAV